MQQEMSSQTSPKYTVPIRSFLKIAAFFLLLALLLVGAGILLNPGRWFLEGRIKDRNARDAEITTIPRDCIDIYNIGNSLAMVGISPMDLWKDEGFTSFNLCKGAAKTSEAYYLLKHGLDYQHPDLILIESNMLFRTRHRTHGVLRVLLPFLQIPQSVAGRRIGSEPSRILYGISDQ